MGEALHKQRAGAGDTVIRAIADSHRRDIFRDETGIGIVRPYPPERVIFADGQDPAAAGRERGNVGANCLGRSRGIAEPAENATAIQHKIELPADPDLCGVLRNPFRRILARPPIGHAIDNSHLAIVVGRQQRRRAVRQSSYARDQPDTEN